jgi:hypothetical protein
MLSPVKASVPEGSAAVVVSAAVTTPSGPLASRLPLAPTEAPVPGSPVEALVVALPDAPTEPVPPDAPVPERAAPAAGLAVKISGTTHATAPAVATADMRPMAWRRDIGVRPSLLPCAITSGCGCSSCMSSTILCRPQRAAFVCVSGFSREARLLQ